jgi:hypothetical protein
MANFIPTAGPSSFTVGDSIASNCWIHITAMCWFQSFSDFGIADKGLGTFTALVVGGVLFGSQ